MIIDASVVLSAYSPDEGVAEAQSIIEGHLLGHTLLAAPHLLVYEVTNVAWFKLRRGIISDDQARALLAAVASLEIELCAVASLPMLALARRFDISVYDASYLALAEARQEPFTTLDRRLYNRVHPDLPWVQLPRSDMDTQVPHPR